MRDTLKNSSSKAEHNSAGAATCAYSTLFRFSIIGVLVLGGVSFVLLLIEMFGKFSSENTTQKKKRRTHTKLLMIVHENSKEIEHLVHTAKSMAILYSLTSILNCIDCQRYEIICSSILTSV